MNIQHKKWLGVGGTSWTGYSLPNPHPSESISAVYQIKWCQNFHEILFHYFAEINS